MMVVGADGCGISRSSSGGGRSSGDGVRKDGRIAGGSGLQWWWFVMVVMC